MRNGAKAVLGRLVTVGEYLGAVALESTMRASVSATVKDVGSMAERVTREEMSRIPTTMAVQTQPLDQREPLPRRPEGKLAQGPARPPGTP